MIRLASSADGGANFTKAIDANAASSASVSDTSTTEPSPVAAPPSSSAAMPPLPSSCAAIIRSASPGPRSTRTRPERDHRKHESRCREQELSHDVSPGTSAFASRRSSSAICAATGWPVSRQWNSIVSGPSPDGTVPGMRLVIVAKLLRACPRGKPVR